MRGLHRVLLDQALREKLKQRGYEQVKNFSWDESARKILKVYEEVADGRRKIWFFHKSKEPPADRNPLLAAICEDEYHLQTVTTQEKFMSSRRLHEEEWILTP